MYRFIFIVFFQSIVVFSQSAPYRQQIDSLINVGISGFYIRASMYSGIPDPVFLLTNTESVSILHDKLLKYHPVHPHFLEKDTSDVQFFSNLGYRFLEIHSFGDTIEIPDFITIFNGNVAITDNHSWVDLNKVFQRDIPIPHVYFYPDPQKDLERTFICFSIKEGDLTTPMRNNIAFTDSSLVICDTASTGINNIFSPAAPFKKATLTPTESVIPVVLTSSVTNGELYRIDGRQTRGAVSPGVYLVKAGSNTRLYGGASWLRN